MGINYQTAYFLAACSLNGKLPQGNVDFARTITLGRQSFVVSKNDCDKLFKKLFNDESIIQRRVKFFRKLECATAPNYPKNRYCEPFIKLLGGGVTDSIDYSDYENATVIHDLSVPISNELKNKYTCVFDGGTLEHVYNYPTALKNAMEMVSVGGHLILTTVGNNFFGHGFYQFSPELFYSVLHEKNGFHNTHVYLCNSNKWYHVEKYEDIHQRTDISPKWPAMLYVVSSKISEVPDNVMAYQSDFEELWTTQKEKGNVSLIRKVYNRLDCTSTPVRYALAIRNIIRYKKRFNTMFTPIDL